MLKKLDQKAKRTTLLNWLVSLFTLAGLVGHILNPYINANLILNILPSLFSTAKSTSEFYGENIDMSQILPSSQHYIVNSRGQDLIDIAANLGINLIRITNVKRSFNNDEDSVYTRDQWNQVLNKMQSKGIKALILIETESIDGRYYTPKIEPVYLHLVREYIDSGVFSHPDVYGVDIKNEPVLTDDNLTMLQAAHAMIKEKYRDLKQTVGWWATPSNPNDPYNPSQFNWSDYTAGHKLDTIVDFYSVHMYGLADSYMGITLGPDRRTKVFVSAVENGLRTKKTILIGEFGEANGDAVSDQDTVGSPQLQANVYQGVYQGLKDMRSSQIIGTVAFDFYSRSQYPDGWAIVKDNGNYLFPAAYILQEYALGKTNPSLRAQTVVTSQSYLKRNADNNTTKDLRLSDRIGLELQLDESKSYSLVLSEDGILQPIEAFHYEPDRNDYFAVYQVKKKGSVRLNIISDKVSTTGTPLIYTLTLTVQ